MRDAADYRVQLRLIELPLLLEGLEPAMRFGRKVLAELLPLYCGDAGLSPARAPVSGIKRILAGAPPVHQREAVPQVIDLRGDRRPVRSWSGGRDCGQL